MSGLDNGAREWLEASGFTVRNEEMWREALTHGSTDEARDYQRLEFLGDRVLGLTIAHWLFQHSEAPEGKMAQRLNALVSKASCAGRARELDVPDYVRLGKQARDDGAQDSDNVLGDVMEALLGANYLDGGYDATQLLIHALWKGAIEGGAGKSKHPKSALQEWAAGNQRRPPEYRVVRTDGPDHARVFTVEVKVHKVGAVEARAGGKQEAETEAARLFMEKYG